jgi:hypothetical protein
VVTLFGRNRFATGQPDSVPHADAQLVVARDKFYEALRDCVGTQLGGENRRLVTFANVLWWHLRIQDLLEARMELHRREQEHHVEEWWCWSWPFTAPPEWPDQDEDEAS